MPREQVIGVKDLLSRAGVHCSVAEDAIRLTGESAADVINLGNADPEAIRALLDQAVVRVSFILVNGGSQQYYEGYALIERYDRLRRQGLDGKALVHELFSDDWGPPPVGITLEGKRKGDLDFNVYIPYR